MAIRPDEYTVHYVAGLLFAHGLITDATRREVIVKAPTFRARIEKREQERYASRRVRYEVSPPEIVAAMGIEAIDTTPIDEDRIMQVVASASGTEWRKIDPLRLDGELIAGTMSRPFARKNVCLPLERSEQDLVVAVDNPFNPTLLHTLRDITGSKIRLVVSSRTDILKSITEVYGFKKAVKAAKNELGGGTDLGNLEQFVKLKSVEDIEATDKHIVNAVDYIFHYAFDQRASDIHIEPRREQSSVRMRIDGVLHEIYSLPRTVHKAVVSRLKMLARLDIAERRRPQDGRIKTDREGREIELRVSTMPVAFGEKIVMRVFDPQNVVAGLDGLGFQAEESQVWNRLIAQPHGLILVTGPTGSGKTSTLYSTLNMLATPEVNVTSIEDPIEMIYDRFNQVAVNSRIELTFAHALRTVLRQDPDIVMVGEIRDADTAEMAVQAALTGHLVLSTLHTNDAPSTITRLRDLGLEPFKIASTLIGVMAQRLVRTICNDCRTETVLTAQQVELLGLRRPDGSIPNLPVHEGAGCVRCRSTGLYGRTGVFEIMEMTPSLRRLVKEDASADALREAAKVDGMRTLQDSAIRKMAQGMTSFAEILRVLGE